MLSFDNGGILVETPDDLPRLPDRINNLFGDFETTSRGYNITSLNPWHNCWVAGLAITWNEEPRAWYIPTAHAYGPKIPLETLKAFWKDVLKRTRKWINSGIKYDMHVSRNCLGLAWRGPVKDTATDAKLVDSDRFKYGLKELSKDWLGEDISRYEAAMAPYLGGNGNKDYGKVPADICGEYACQDVLSNRKVFKVIEERRPEISKKLSETEDRVTSILWKLENRGICVDPDELVVANAKATYNMLRIHSELEKKVGFNFRPHANADCEHLLCHHFGLPVLAYTTDKDGIITDSPSFNKEALKEYLRYPGAPVDIIEQMLEYRMWNTLSTYFAQPYQRLHINGVLHPFYTQTVRTGRMACKWPNQQQLNKWAKKLIHPHPGYTFLSIDYSQVEFRLIVHYCNNTACLRAYSDDPFTDFHTWVATMCRIHRKPAKNVNFCMGYGGGEKRLLRMLKGNMELMESLKDVAKSPEHFDELCEARAKGVYDTYHDTLPELRQVSKNAEWKMKQEGYVRNLYNRVRRMPVWAAHRAFNSLCQSSAADLMKERLVALDDHITANNLDIYIVGVVHDEVVFEVRDDQLTQDNIIDLVRIMESPDCPRLRVPIRCSFGISKDNWADTSSVEMTAVY